MTILFVREGLVDPFIVSVDRRLLNNGHVWHKSSVMKNINPYPGIDPNVSGATAKPSDGYLDTSWI